MAPIFEEKDRSDDRPKTRDEHLFAFYDRAARRPFAVFRDLVNAWLADMPVDAAAEVVKRMRKGDDLGFATGLSEIVLHTTLRRLGFVLEAHPEIPGIRNRLDFLIRQPDGTRVAYLEITTMNPPAAEVARDRREAIVFEALNGAVLPDDLRLSYEVASFGMASPSVTKIRAAVERWASAHADAARNTPAVDETFLVDDWKLRLALISGFAPRPGGRQIAVYGIMNGRFVGAVPPTNGLAKALDAKATKYGELDLPYVIAVFDRTNSLAWSSSDFGERVAEVLFGSEEIEELVMSSGQIRSRETRAGNGRFGHTGAPRSRGVSAVLVFPTAEPWNLAEIRGQPLLVRHPWAIRPLPDGILPMQELVIDDLAGRIVPGRMMSEILGLPDPWPPLE